ncbi:hypothetical protein GCM10010206_61420 [Streptomyces cinerochromogenes]|nr:hypothetical protein GCM10010206_61420 [Streptomyces cinerochromogenes]
MRYPQGGGLTAERQQFREELRLEAAERFAQGEASSVIARALRINVRSVQRWRQKWEEGGPRALRSQGPASLPRLSQEQFAQLDLVQRIRRGLRHIQYRSELIDGCLAETGLAIRPT